ncbi:MAG: hypothetical protein WC182_03245 [Bacilli bacterium]
MGFWSTSLYGNDISLDVKDKYSSLLSKGLSKEDAYKEMLEAFSECLLTEDAPIFWFAFADQMWEYGLLEDEVKHKTLNYISEYAFLEEFETLREKRLWQNTLHKLKEKLEQPNQGHKKIVIEIPFKRTVWEIGDYYAYEFHKKYSKQIGLNSKFIVIQKIGESYYGDSMYDYNIVQVFNKVFDYIPELHEVNDLPILPLSIKFDFYDSPNITKRQKEIMEQNIRESLQGDLHYFTINEYKEKYFHFIGNNRNKLPKVRYNVNGYLEFRTLEKDLCEYYTSWNQMNINILIK